MSGQRIDRDNTPLIAQKHYLPPLMPIRAPQKLLQWVQKVAVAQTVTWAGLLSTCLNILNNPLWSKSSAAAGGCVKTGEVTKKNELPAILDKQKSGTILSYLHCYHGPRYFAPADGSSWSLDPEPHARMPKKRGKYAVGWSHDQRTERSRCWPGTYSTFPQVLQSRDVQKTRSFCCGPRLFDYGAAPPLVSALSGWTAAIIQTWTRLFYSLRPWWDAMGAILSNEMCTQMFRPRLNHSPKPVSRTELCEHV